MTDPELQPLVDKAHEWITFDVLETAHALTDGDPGLTAALGLSLLGLAQEQRKMFLSELCDTYYRMPWDKADESIGERGFVVGGKYEQQGTGWGACSHQLVAAHPTRKLLLTASSSQINGTDVLDVMNLYAVVDTHGDHAAWMTLWNANGGCNSHLIGDIQDKEDWRFAMSWTVTNGLGLVLDAIEQSRVDVIDWPKQRGPLRHFFGSEYYRLPEAERAAMQAAILADLPDWLRRFTSLGESDVY